MYEEYMADHNFPLLDDNLLGKLKPALLYLHVDELKNLCLELGIHDKGAKGMLITRILHFIKSGETITEPIVPGVSKAKRNVVYSLHPETLMLKGAYKNDLKTRLFFKQLIGEHFHFTAFGIDWLNDRWLKGEPPTYQEFAEMWKVEHTKRKQLGSTPKEEWAYINFAQNLVRVSPQATRDEIIYGWNIERAKQKVAVSELIANAREYKSR